MKLFLFILELIGTVAFAVSGALTGYGKRMDIFGVALLGLTTAVGGGTIRDVLLGSLPPAVFQNPLYVAVALCVSILMFIALRRRILSHSYRLFERVLFLSDTIGLGIFTVVGVKAAFLSGSDNLMLAVFVGALTGVGGGVLRDIFADDTPYIFVKHIYACAATAGALLCALLWSVNDTAAMLSGMALVWVIRVLAAHFRWSLPKATGILPTAEETTTQPPATNANREREDGTMNRVLRNWLNRILFGAGTEAFWHHREKATAAKTALARRYHNYRCIKICTKNGASIPSTTRIDGRLTMPHGMSGIVISKGAAIGHGCTVFQQVTIGSNTIEGSKTCGAPVIGNDVYIGAGAKIIGGITVGDHVRIGANCVVVEDIPANSTVVLQKPRILLRQEQADNAFHTFEATNGR